MGWSVYKHGVKTFSPTPTGASGAAVSANFGTLADYLDGVALLAAAAFTGAVSTTSTLAVGTATANSNAQQTISVNGSAKAALALTDSAASGRTFWLHPRAGNVAGKFGIYDQTATAYRLVIDSSGNVGVNTTSPGCRFEAVGGTTLSGTANFVTRAVQDKTDYRGVGLGYDTFGQVGLIYADTGSSASSLAFWTYSGSAWGERLRIDGNGNVGIGTATPSGKLHVVGTAKATTIETGKILDSAEGDDAITFGEQQTTFNHATVDFEGDVGIGTASPSTKLHVEGGRITHSDGAHSVQMFAYSPGGVAYMGTPTATALTFRVNGADQLTLNTGAAAFTGTVSATSFSGFGITPIGSITAWHKSLTGTPSLPAGWVECNGQTLSDAASPYNGQAMPDLNNVNATDFNAFLRGNPTSGTTGGQMSHSHQVSSNNSLSADQNFDGTYNSANFVDNAYTDAQNHIPPYFDVVWIIRVK